MTTATVADQVERVLKPIQQFVRGWMTGPPTDRLAVDLGMRSGSDLWIVGRAGVLGDGDADVAAAGLAFLAPARVREAWESLPDGLTHRQVADAYAALCCRWGSTELAKFDRQRMDTARRTGPANRRRRRRVDRCGVCRLARAASARRRQRPGGSDHARAARDAWRRAHHRGQRLWDHPARRCAGVTCASAPQRAGLGGASRLDAVRSHDATCEPRSRGSKPND